MRIRVRHCEECEGNGRYEKHNGEERELIDCPTCGGTGHRVSFNIKDLRLWQLMVQWVTWNYGKESLKQLASKPDEDEVDIDEYD